MPDGEVPKADLDLVTCDYLECGSKGEYTNCYLNLEKRCKIYVVHEIEKRRKYIDRAL